MVVCGENSQERRVFVVVSGVITFIKKKKKKSNKQIYPIGLGGIIQNDPIVDPTHSLLKWIHYRQTTYQARAVKEAKLFPNQEKRH